MKRLARALVLLSVTGLNFWAGHSIYSRRAAAIQKKLACISYDPRYRFSKISAADLRTRAEVPEEWIEEDLAKISNISNCVRIYDVTHGLEKVPGIALRHSLTVIAGVDITKDRGRNTKSAQSAIDLAERFPNIVSIIVGNETLLHNWLRDRDYIEPAELYGQIAAVRGRTQVPVSTAEPYKTWIAAKDLASRVDFIAINELPYWSRQSLEAATRHLERMRAELKRLYPGKNILLSEVGWPSGGPANGSAVPGRAEMESFLASFLAWAESAKIDYNYFEAFDQPWKYHEGRVGTQWGIFSAAGTHKLGRVSPFNVWALFSALSAFLICLALMPSRKWIGYGSILYLIFSIHGLVFLLTWAMRVSVKQYFSRSLDFWLFIALPMTALFCVVLISLLESVEALSRDSMFEASPLAPHLDGKHASQPPFVSIHVPCCREPADMVISTLRSLLALNYPAYEIIVMDNNTPDPNLYEPVARFCARHADKIRFFHEARLAGYKSGALNYALNKTSPEASIIAVIDSDYVVKPQWLKDLTPHFEDPGIAVVQAPQAYRNWEGKFFSTMIRSEYEGFFRTTMIQRSFRNAIIQHGTMLLLRREALEKVGRWAEWCITEDTELGLRILLAGHRAVYVAQVYGEGLIPQSAEAYFKQRFRWVAGGASILRRYVKEFAGIRPGLTRAQRYCFITGWLPWLVDSAAPVFTLVGLVGAILCLRNNLYFPPVEFAYPFIFYFLFRFVTATSIYLVRVRIGWRDSLLASVAGMSLTWVIAAAGFRGLSRKPLAFYRTRKSSETEESSRDSWIWRFLDFRGDLVLAWTLSLCAFGLLFKYQASNREALVWSIVLFLLALPLVSSGVLLFSSRQYAEIRGIGEDARVR